MKSIMNTIFFNKKTTIATFLLLFITVTNVFSANKNLKPFKVVVVIGTQWEDPSSYVVAIPKPTGKYSGYDAAPEVQGATDFHHLTILLKSWGIPFDIIRLDQQLMDRYMFLDMYDEPKYGTIIWDVNKSDKLLHPDYSIITEMVEDYGIGLIALSDRISQPEIQSLLGLKYIGSWESNTKMEIISEHFLTKGLNSPFEIDEGFDGHKQRQRVELQNGAKVIVEQGGYPQVTVREFTSGGYTVWIGGDHNYLFYFGDIRTLLRRAITWTVGYSLYKTYENEIIMIMDDPGGSQNTYLEHWHHPALTEEVIDKYMIKPLKENNAVLNINFVPGFVNDKKGRLEPTWKEQYVDGFGVKQDYVSGKRGYEKGIKQGVFEVMCHGLTHMQPDLVSKPGWYGAPIDEEKAEVGWYREFSDTRRQKEIPAAEQLWRMNTAKDWIMEQFGKTPLEFCAGGLGMSTSYNNNTVKLAGKAGFGWCGWKEGYLGKDMVILKWEFLGKESPLIAPSLPDAHNYGITYAPEKFAAIFEEYPNGRFISINEFIGYLHANNSGKWADEKKLSITLNYDSHYCRYFAEHPTSWHLELADWLISEKGTPKMNIDGENINSGYSIIKVPEGVGEHTVKMEFDR